MKDDWERVVPPRSLDPGQISKIIDSVFHGKRVVAFERIGTGLSNSNYKILIEGDVDPLVLRVYEGEKAVALKERSIVDLVRKTVPVADHIYTDIDCTLIDKPWAILEWKEGSLLSELLKAGNPPDVASSASSVGKVLAEIHKYGFSNSGFFGEYLEIDDPLILDGEQFLSLIRDFLKNTCGTFLGEPLKHKVWSFCRENRNLLSENGEGPVLVHSDFNGLNIMMRRAPAGMLVSAVLDWEFAFSGSRYADIGNMLRYEEVNSFFEKHFIESYEKHGKVLDDNWRLLSRLQDLIALCDLLNRSTKYAPKRVEELINLISRTIGIRP